MVFSRFLSVELCIAFHPVYSLRGAMTEVKSLGHQQDWSFNIVPAKQTDLERV